ncbi:MAG: N-acetylmuramoyl-L-alanine amidase [Muribaculaceae bacterium]|nr:N-acetylmuramoyl-L-alanine amidase [Muribaculaceae bacterium]
MNISRLLQCIGTVFALLLIAGGNSSYATDASQLRIYINPGHGSWGPNDRPMATIPYPNLSSTGRPDTCGFYESNTNLWKAQKLRQCLINAGMLPQNVVMSRNYNGPYPYVAGAADAEIYNKPLSEICEEADAGNFDMFFSIHSNSTTDGALTNYSLYLYRGTDAAESVAGSEAMAQAIWPHASVGANQLDYASHYTASANIRGDISFYGSSSTRYGSKGNYTGYLGVLKHGVPGFLAEGYFHTYQPARHRALNKDYCYQEGVRYFRGIASYFGLPAESTGYIMGAVKDQAQSVNNSLYTYQSGTRAGDEYLPVMGAVVSLYKDGNLVADYTTDNKYNGIFVFENLQPGPYTLKTTANGYADKTETVTVTANATASPLLYLTADTSAPRGIFAYGLDLTDNGNDTYTFTFTPNVKPQAARLVFYDSNGNQVGNGLTLTNVTSGENVFTFNKSQLPGSMADGNMTWGVELEGEPITAFTKLNTDNAAQWTFTRACPIVDNSPESDYFGRVYASVWEGISNSANGIWAYAPDWTRLNSSVFRNFYDVSGDAVTLRTNYRLGIDYTGTVYMSEYGDPTSGIFLVFPDRIVNNHKSFNFFKGTRTTSGSYAGVWKSGTTEIGSSTSAVSVAGTGPDTKLYMLIEDFANNKNDVAVYNLVDATSGAFQTTWAKAPSAILDVSGSGTTNCGQLHADDKGGVWISHYNKSTAASALVYSNASGSVVFNSSAISATLNGTRGGGFAVSPDNSRLAIGDADGNICLYNITWSGATPSLTFINKFTGVDVKDNTTSSGTNQQPNGIYQMSFDWGGNLVVGGKGIGIYSIPTASNITVTPAKKRLTVNHAPSRVYSAANLRVCLDPGHGGFTSNDRNMVTINHALNDTTGFYESNTNLWKMQGARIALFNMGLQRNNVVMTRYRNSTAPGSNDYDIPLSERRAIADQGNFDIFVSVHSNASGDFNSNGEFATLVENGVYGNFPLFIYRGRTGKPALRHSDEMSATIWRRHWLTTDIDPQSRPEITQNAPYIVGDLDYYDPTINTGADKGPEWGYNSITGHTNYGYLGVLRHSVPGLLIEGFCHQYHPTAQRALNKDYCRQMGVRIARGIVEYFGIAGETTGYIMGTVKDKKQSLENNLYKYRPGSVDAYLPINGATVSLYSGETLVDTYTTDGEYNGIFVFSDLAPGRYRLVTSYTGYDDDEQIVDVTANETTYPLVYLNNDDTTPKGIFAYNLISTRNQVDGSYTFTFTPNANTKRASLIFYDAATGAQVGDAFPINNAEEGVITSVTLTQEQLPGSGGQTLNWAVSLTGKPITEITTLNDPDNFSFNRIGNIVDNSPESDYFGRFYLINRIASGNSDNGLWAYNQDWSKINSTVIRNSYTDSNPFRLATDQNGKIYIANFADGATSGVYTVDPATLAAPTPFFVGTHASDGTITAGNGDVICTSTASVFITGTGVNTHMYCHFEDGTKDIAQYNIGNSDGSIVSSWSTAPSRSWGIGSMLASLHAAVIGETDNGIWIVQNRGAGQNTSTVPSLMYVANDGTIKYNSANDNAFTTACTGTQYAAGALSADGTELVVNQPDGKLKFFSISYNNNEPTLTYKYDYAAGAGNQVTQINYDWGGNLFVSGSKLAILALPQSDNTHVTPAQKALTVVKDNETHYTLAQLVVDGTPGSRYALDGEYTCVYIDKSSQVLYCKDNNLAANKSEAAGRVNYARTHALMTGDYDQSNWIAITLPRALYTNEYEDYQGHLISDIHGLYTDGLNPALTASEMPSAGDVAEYSPNVYIPCNFITANLALENYFFVRPKPQEYAIITWAVYDSNTQGFYVTESTATQNVENLTGGVKADFSLIPGDADPTEFFTDDEAYRFPAIIRQKIPGNSAPRVTKANVTGANTDAVSDSFTVYPLEMSRDGIITHILNTDENAQRNIIATKYFTPAGIELPQAPDSGVYIEVKLYDDGSRDSRKLMR